MTTDPQQLLAAANSLQTISTPLMALQVEIYLLQTIAGNTMTPQQLLAAANQYQQISDATTARQVIIALLAQIVNEV